MEEQEKSLAESQLDCQETLNKVYHLLRQDVLRPNKENKGLLEWTPITDATKRVLTDVGVDKLMQVKGNKDVFILGDAASTKFAGMAQTALSDGGFVANTISSKLNGDKPKEYVPKKSSYAIPVGPGWAAVLYRGRQFYGSTGWAIRRIADFKFFKSILSTKKAYLTFTSGKTLCESCEICSVDLTYSNDIDKEK